MATNNALNNNLTGCTNLSLTTGVTGILPVANGGTGVATSNTILKIGRLEVTNFQTATTVIPLDDTKPQVTEGDEMMTLSYTPISASSVLMIEVNAAFARAEVGHVSTAVFRDGAADAIGATSARIDDANAMLTYLLRFYITSGSTSASTFSVRVGPNSAGTVTFNGQSGAGIFGGASYATLVITEYAS